MKIFDMQRQGECLFIQVDSFEDNDSDYNQVKSENGNLIVAHSESGHHHVIEIERSKSAELLIHKTNNLIGRLIANDDCTEIKHLRGFDTHETLKLPRGKYVLRYRREYTPEGLRKVRD